MGTNLAALSQGLVQKTVQKPVIATANETTTVKVSEPAVGYDLSADQVNAVNGEFAEFFFNNTTGQNVNIYFFAIMANEGDFTKFNIPPTAIDFAGFFEGSYGVPPIGAHAVKLQAFLEQLASTELIISRIEVIAGTNNQAIQRAQVGFFNWNQEFVAQSRITALCDPCTPNNNPNVFNRIIPGPIAIGGNYGFVYPVLSGESPNLRLIVGGEANIHTYSQQNGSES